MPSLQTPEHDQFASLDSDGECKVVEGAAEPMSARGPGGDVVVAPAEVLHEGVSGGENPDGAVTLQSVPFSSVRSTCSSSHKADVHPRCITEYIGGRLRAAA